MDSSDGQLPRNSWYQGGGGGGGDGVSDSDDTGSGCGGDGGTSGGRGAFLRWDCRVLLVLSDY